MIKVSSYFFLKQIIKEGLINWNILYFWKYLLEVIFYFIIVLLFLFLFRSTKLIE